jgi:hypothetical protein
MRSAESSSAIRHGCVGAVHKFLTRILHGVGVCQRGDGLEHISTQAAGPMTISLNYQFTFLEQPFPISFQSFVSVTPATFLTE